MLMKDLEHGVENMRRVTRGNFGGFAKTFDSVQGSRGFVQAAVATISSTKY